MRRGRAVEGETWLSRGEKKEEETLMTARTRGRPLEELLFLGSAAGRGRGHVFIVFVGFARLSSLSSGRAEVRQKVDP